MYPTLLISLIFLISSSFSQWHYKLTKESTDLITDLFIKARSKLGTYHDFRKFLELLESRQFVANYPNKHDMDYVGFVHFLKTRRRTFSKIELLLPRVYVNQHRRDYFELIFSLKLTNIMNYTVTEKYHFGVKFWDEERFEILKIDIDLEDEPQSIWEPKCLEVIGLKATEFAKKMSKLVPFKVDKTHFAEENFMGLIDTDYDNVLNLDDFMRYVTEFKQNHEIKQNSIKSFEVLTETIDHVVFRAGIPINYPDEAKRWYFEIEATYIQNSWKILKIFVRHPFEDNQIIKRRAAMKLYMNLKNEFKNLLEMSNVIELPETFTDKVISSNYNICEFFSVPGKNTKIKLPMWTKKVEILGIQRIHKLIIQLYYPEVGRLLNFVFSIEYNTVMDISEIVRITVKCPEWEETSEKLTFLNGVRHFKDELLDLEPIVVYNKQEMLGTLFHQLNETVPFNNPESVRDLFASNFTAITTIYPDQSYEHNWDSFKKFMRIFNGKYLYINTSSECSFGRAETRIISQENSRATFEVLKIFKFEYEEEIEDQQMDLWKFTFEVKWDSSGAWEVQRLLINPINKVGKYRAVLAVQIKTQIEVERIAKLPVRKLFFDPEWAEYFVSMYIKLYDGNVPWELNSTFIFDKYNIHRTRPLTTIFEHEPEDAPADFTIIVEADDNSITVRLPIEIYCIYIEEYDNYFIQSIFVKDMEYL